jgi:phosphohistidine phosphatase
MRCCLVHHADAVAPHVDAQRPLSERGIRQAEAMAAALRETGFSPTAIWHSGKLRARQTGEPYLRLCNPSAEFRMVRGLRSEDPPDWIALELTAETRDVMAVGHMPSISLLAERLSPDCFGVPLNGWVLFEKDGDGWTEIARMKP